MLPQLIMSVKLIMQDQERLKENVVVSQGDWHFSSQYQNLQVAFVFTDERQCKAVTHKVFSQKPILPTGNVNPPHSSHALSVSVDDCGLTNIAQDTLQGKAESLVKSNGHIIKAP